MVVLVSSVGGFALGFLSSVLVRILRDRSKVFKIKRFYPNLSYAREVYNQISLQFDKQFTEFKLLEIDIKYDKIQQAHALVVKYKSLNGKRFSF